MTGVLDPHDPRVLDLKQAYHSADPQDRERILDRASQLIGGDRGWAASVLGAEDYEPSRPASAPPKPPKPPKPVAKVPDKHLEEAKVIDFAVAVQKDTDSARRAVVLKELKQQFQMLVTSDKVGGFLASLGIDRHKQLEFVAALQHKTGPDAVEKAHDSYYQGLADIAREHYGIVFDPHVARMFLAALKNPGKDPKINGFLKRVDGDAALKKRVMAGTKDYSSLAKTLREEGLDVSAEELERYLEPWRIIGELNKSLVAAGTITAEQFEKTLGVSHRDYSFGVGNLYGSAELDQELMGAVLTGSRGVSLLSTATGLPNLAFPISVLAWPVAAMATSGHTYTWKQIGQIFESSLYHAMVGMTDSLFKIFGGSR